MDGKREGMTVWPMLSYQNTFSFLMFFPSELGSKTRSDYKNSKAYSYYKSEWLQPLQSHNLSRTKYSIHRVECRKFHSTKNPFHKPWIIIEKTLNIRTCHCMCTSVIQVQWQVLIFIWEKHVTMLQL